jgi:hypothetical protein
LGHCLQVSTILAADAELRSVMAMGDKSVLEVSAAIHLHNCSPSVAQAFRARVTEISDAAIRTALAMGDTDMLERAASEHLVTCSTDVVQMVMDRRQYLADLALHSVLNTGDLAALEEAAKLHLHVCKENVGHRVELMLSTVRRGERALREAIQVCNCSGQTTRPHLHL